MQTRHRFRGETDSARRRGVEGAALLAAAAGRGVWAVLAAQKLNQLSATHPSVQAWAIVGPQLSAGLAPPLVCSGRCAALRAHCINVLCSTISILRPAHQHQQKPATCNSNSPWAPHHSDCTPQQPFMACALRPSAALITLRQPAGELQRPQAAGRVPGAVRCSARRPTEFGWALQQCVAAEFVDN